jgi:predicted lipoprotein with Yx(FWY)xxD motif
MLKSGTTGVGKVLTNEMGRTLYWFALDTSTASKCIGSCAVVWPPVTGTPRLASGVHAPGKLGTIRRPGRQLQATYDGHPLYTYAGDHARGQAHGNGIMGFGGRWHAVMLPGAGMTASPGTTSKGGGGGY